MEDFKMEAMPLEPTSVESAPWWRFLSRWSLVTALVALGLVGVFLGGIGIAASDSALGPEYVELMQAVRSPVLYRVAMVLDVLGWLTIGGSLLTLAGLLRGHAPIRATFIAACGFSQLT